MALSIDGDHLNIIVPDGVPTRELVERTRAYKQEIVQLLAPETKSQLFTQRWNQISNVNKKEEFQNMVSSIVAETKLPGVAAMLYEDGEIYAATSGFIDNAHSFPYTLGSFFRIGCIVKLFVATLIMILRDKGEINLDAHVASYLPAVANHNGKMIRIVTVRQLLTHSSGLAVSLDDRVYRERGSMHRLVDILKRKTEKDLFLFEPGEYCSYSDLGYAMLSYVIESIRGKSWIRDMKGKIFDPLVINCYQLNEDASKNTYAPFGQHIGSGTKNPYNPQRVLPNSGGSLALSVNDLMKFCILHLGDGTSCAGRRILSQDSVDEMREEVSIPFAPGSGLKGFGCGWMVNEDGSFGLFGNGIGNHALIKICPERNMALAIVANYHSAWPLFERVWTNVIFSNASNLNFSKELPRQSGMIRGDLFNQVISGTYSNSFIRYNILYEKDMGFVCIDLHEDRKKKIEKKTAHKMLHVEGSHFVVPGLGEHNEFWFLDLSGSGDSDYLWCKFFLLKKVC